MHDKVAALSGSVSPIRRRLRVEVAFFALGFSAEFPLASTRGAEGSVTRASSERAQVQLQILRRVDIACKARRLLLLTRAVVTDATTSGETVRRRLKRQRAAKSSWRSQLEPMGCAAAAGAFARPARGNWCETERVWRRGCRDQTRWRAGGSRRPRVIGPRAAGSCAPSARNYASQLAQKYRQPWTASFGKWKPSPQVPGLPFLNVSPSRRIRWSVELPASSSRPLTSSFPRPATDPATASSTSSELVEFRRLPSTTIRFPKLSMGCQTSKDVLPASPSEQRPSLSQIFLQAASKQQARDESGVGAHRPPMSDSHRDVFSIFGERGMSLETSRSPSNSDNCSPASPSGSVFSTATTASDTERTLVLHRPVGQYFPQLRVSYGVFSDTGIRKNNEDRQTSTSRKVDDELVAFFGLYDGHGGPEVAEYLAENLHENVFSHLRKPTNEPESARSLQTPDLVLTDAVRTAFAATDEEIFKRQLPSGSTAVCVVIRGNMALVSSVGDSQVVLSTNGQAKDMCIAHTPELSSERDRILAAKGQISKGRIYGMLGVSRAFGDIDFKTGRGEFKSRFNGDLVSATPDLVVHEIKSQDEFMVLGCDGLYDVMEPQDVVNFVRAKLGLHGDVQHATEELVSHALALGSTDNVSAIIVCFNQDEQEVLPVTPIEAAQAAEAQKKRAAAAVADSV